MKSGILPIIILSSFKVDTLPCVRKLWPCHTQSCQTGGGMMLQRWNHLCIICHSLDFIYHLSSVKWEITKFSFLCLAEALKHLLSFIREMRNNKVLRVFVSGGDFETPALVLFMVCEFHEAVLTLFVVVWKSLLYYYKAHLILNLRRIG